MHKNNAFSYKWICMLLWPWAVVASDHEFAWQWPLSLAEPHASAYQITLDESVYQAVYWPDWRDIQVLDADNQPVPAVVYLAPKPQTHTSSQFVDLPWFALPTQAQTATDLNIVVKRDTDGSIITINDRSTTTQQQPASSPAWLIDSAAYSGQLHALHVEWSDPEAVLDMAYRLEASNDLRQWQVLVPEVRLLQLHNDQKQLRNNRITFNTQQRYLRLIPLQRNVAAPKLQRLRGEIVKKTAAQPTWHWLELTAEADHEPGGFEYRLSGRFPVQKLDIILPVNSTATWQVFSHEEEKSNNPSERISHWIMRSNAWYTWRINGKSAEAQTTLSPALDLGQTFSSQQWRLQLTSPAALSTAPTLRLGWQPGHVIFLAQGRAPYTLVAGSAHIQTTLNQHALEPMLAVLRQHNDANWQPATATLGKAALRAGENAYQLPPTDIEFNWQKLLLWGVLISGVLIVGQFATNLLRRIPDQTQDKQDQKEL